MEKVYRLMIEVTGYNCSNKLIITAPKLPSFPKYGKAIKIQVKGLGLLDRLEAAVVISYAAIFTVLKLIYLL